MMPHKPTYEFHIESMLTGAADTIERADEEIANAFKG